MDKKIASIFAFILTLFLLFASCVLIFECINSRSGELIVPSIILTLLSLITIIFLVLDVFIGRRSYIFKKDSIIVGRKGKTICSIPKECIESPYLVIDANSKKISYFRFTFNKNKHVIIIDKRNEEQFNRFIAGIDVNRKENFLQYILTYIVEIFCI